MEFLRDFIQDLSIPFLALAAGLYWYKHLSTFHRLVLYQVAVYVVIDIIAINIKVNHGNSGWTYNLLMPIETALLLMSAATVFSSKIFKSILLLMFLVFTSVFCYDITSAGFLMFAYHASTVQAILLLVLFMSLIYQLFKESRKTKALICSMTGMSLYFAAVIPFIGVMFYIDNRDINLSETLFELIVVPSQILRYFLIGIGFYLEARSIKKQKQIQLAP